MLAVINKVPLTLMKMRKGLYQEILCHIGTLNIPQETDAGIQDSYLLLGSNIK